jgi:nucleotide-binding universal stress UspA family protein
MLLQTKCHRQSSSNNYSGGTKLMLQKILIAMGDSQDSATILKSGLTLAEKFGAEVAIFHALNLLPTGFETLGSPLMGITYPIASNGLEIEQYQQELKDREQAGMERLQSYAKYASDLKLKTDIFQSIGDAGQTICAIAKSYAADLIVMGRNQRSILSEIFLGSTSNYVLHHAPCSVLVIQQH